MIFRHFASTQVGELAQLACLWPPSKTYQESGWNSSHLLVIRGALFAVLLVYRFCSKRASYGQTHHDFIASRQLRWCECPGQCLHIPLQANVNSEVTSRSWRFRCFTCGKGWMRCLSSLLLIFYNGIFVSANFLLRLARSTCTAQCEDGVTKRHRKAR